MKNEHHAEFPQFRAKLAAKKRQSVARESLHSMERSLSQCVPAEEVQKLSSLPVLGTGCSFSPWFSGHFCTGAPRPFDMLLKNSEDQPPSELKKSEMRGEIFLSVKLLKSHRAG